MSRIAVRSLTRPAWSPLRIRRSALAPYLVGSRIRNFASGPLFEEQDLTALKVNGKRMMDTLHATCEFGKAHPYGQRGSTETGMARLTLNDDDKRVREWLTDELKALGCDVRVDKIGNMFAVLPAQQMDLAPIMMGSHLDTQPTGGRYDGILGIMAALEALRTIKENGIQTRRPIGLVNWTNEEGARFPKTTMGSSVWAGSLPLNEALSMTEVPSLAQDSKQLCTVKEELERIGFLGSTEASHEAVPIAAHFELHIEQGPILEDENLKIGVVTGGQAYRWEEVTVTGRDSHAGTTPFKLRSDPMTAAAMMITKARQIARTLDGLATVGIIHALPGSINTIPHTVKFTLDIRNPSTKKMTQQWYETRKMIKKLAESTGKEVKFKLKNLTTNAVVKFDKDCIQAIQASATAALPTSDGKKLWKHMISGAGHDSCAVQTKFPAAMIFTPTRNGMSHCPDEYCSPEDCELGAQVLLGAVLRYELKDRLKA